MYSYNLFYLIIEGGKNMELLTQQQSGGSFFFGIISTVLIIIGSWNMLEKAGEKG